MMLFYAILKGKRLIADIDRVWKIINEYNIGDIDSSETSYPAHILTKGVRECPYDIASEIHKVAKMESDLNKLQVNISKAYEDVQDIIFERDRIRLTIDRLESLNMKRDPKTQGFRALDELRRDDLITSYMDRILEIDELLAKHEHSKKIEL